MFQKQLFVIRYNRKWLRTSEQEKTIKSAFHEAFHAVQYSAVIGFSIGLKNNLFTDDEMNQIVHEFMDYNYDDSIETWGLYLVEQHDEGLAIELYKKFINQYKNIEDFMDEFYEMYPNIE